MPPRGKPNIPPRQRKKLPDEPASSSAGGQREVAQMSKDRDDPTTLRPATQVAGQTPPDIATPAGQTAGSAAAITPIAAKKKPSKKGKGKKKRGSSDEESDGIYYDEEKTELITQNDDWFVGKDEFIAKFVAATKIAEGETGLTPSTDPKATGHQLITARSYSSLLQPPRRGDTSSSASSLGSKRPRENSPPSDRKARRESHRGKPQRGRRSERHSRPQSPSSSHEQIRQLERQLDIANQRLASEYNAGVQDGRVRGFEDAMKAAGYVQREVPTLPIREPTYGHTEPRPYDKYGRDEQYTRDLRYATEESRRTAQYAASQTYDSGAGPSRASASRQNTSHQPSPPSRRQPSPTSRRPSPPSSRRPSPPPSRRPPPPPPPSQPKQVEQRSFTVTVRAPGLTDWIDAKSIRYQDVTNIPIPYEAKTSEQDKRDVTISCDSVPEKAEDAKSYLELWCAFAMGLTMPDALTGLYKACGRSLNAHLVRSAAMGYVISRRIAVATEKHLSKNALRAFFIVLAAYQRYRPLASGLWKDMLSSLPEKPFDNWSEVRRFAQHPSCQKANFGITFTPPARKDEPWSVRTQWQEDEFMQLLIAIRPSSASLIDLLYYVDAFVRTRPASAPAAGMTIEGYTREMTFPAPFISAPIERGTFIPLESPPAAIATTAAAAAVTTAATATATTAATDPPTYEPAMDVDTTME